MQTLGWLVLGTAVLLAVLAFQVELMNRQFKIMRQQIKNLMGD